MIERIISGGQNGADVAGVSAALERNIPTGGTMPAGFKTLDGPCPEYAERYGMVEHASSSYVPRTFQNVRDSDGTLRIAADFGSAGEKCTMKAIKQYGKPYFDVFVKDVSTFTCSEEMHPKAAAKWVIDNNIKVLNIAGNSEKTSNGIGVYVKRYVIALIEEVRRVEQDHSTSI